MKETVKINLAQRLFDLDEDAYIKLKNYLDSLNKYFNKSSQESEDILFDIEQRIAEILDEKLKDKRQAITLEDIDEVIQKMGTAEDFERDTDFMEDDSPLQEKESASDDYSKSNRHLYRDTERNILGGVCAGLAAFFNIDLIWIRLAFIILFFLNLIGLILYLILWVIVPPALSRTQKLQMKGKPVNIENIEESVKNELYKVKDNFTRLSESEGFKRTRDTAGEIFTVFGKILLLVLKIIAVIIGIGLAIAGLALLFSLFAALVAGSVWSGWNIPDLNISENIVPFFQNITLLSVAVCVVILIPVIAILAGVIRLIFNLNRGNNFLMAFAWTFWALALVFVLITFFVGRQEDLFGYHYNEVEALEITSNKPLYLRLDEEHKGSPGMGYYTIFGKEIVFDKWNDRVLLEPEIEIVKSNDLLTTVSIEYSTLIPWDYEGEKFEYDYVLKDSVLVLANYWSIDEDNLWRLPRVKVRVHLSESQMIHLDRDFKSVPTRVNGENKWPDWYYGKMLFMGADGLNMKTEKSN